MHGYFIIKIFVLFPDSTCLVWGKTCTDNGNCWLYNAALLRKKLNYNAAIFFCIGLFFDFLIWLNVSDLNMFGDPLEMVEKNSKLESGKNDKNEKIDNCEEDDEARDLQEIGQSVANREQM